MFAFINTGCVSKRGVDDGILPAGERELNLVYHNFDKFKKIT
jgi:hypothetical protein